MQGNTGLADHHCCHLAKGLQVDYGGEWEDGGWKGTKKDGEESPGKIFLCTKMSTLDFGTNSPSFIPTVFLSTCY